jgi:hypothetical protein
MNKSEVSTENSEIATSVKYVRVAFCELFVISFNTYCMTYRSRDSSVAVALGYGLDDRGSMVRFPAGAGNFCLHHRV